MSIDDPNIVLPLATSYNERGVAGYTHVVTNAEDQRKINCFYEVTKNPMTGKGTLTLSKRPGVTISSSIFFTSSDSAQTAYLIVNSGASFLTSDVYAVINKDTSNNIRSAVPAGANVTISSAGATYSPAFIDLTSISNVVNTVLQLRSVSGTQLVYFITNTNLQAGNPWTQISDGDFPTVTLVGKLEHLDGFCLGLNSLNQIVSSDSNSLANWTAGNFISKQMKQDRPMGLARLANKIVAFGEYTAEVFYNAGNTVGSPLGRITQLHSQVGLVGTPFSGSMGGTHYYCTVNQKLYFVGRYSQASNCGLFSFDGNSFNKISPVYIDKILTEKISAIYSVNSIVISNLPMVVICFTAPGASQQISLVYSPEWNEWFEWNSTVFSPVNSGKFYLGLGSKGNRVYSFTGSSDNWTDDGTNYQFQTQFRLPTNGSSLKRMVFYGVEADTDTSSNFISVDVSDNDCQSFYSLQPLDLTWDRKINFRGGSYTKRHVRLSATDDRPKRLHNFIANVVD